MTTAAMGLPLVGRGLELAQFAGGGFGRRVLFSNHRLKVVLAAFEPGQEIPVHAPEVDLVMSILEGLGDVRAGDQIHSVKAGDIVIIPAGSERGVRARTRLVALHVVSPPPTEADHRWVEDGASWPNPEVGPDVAALISVEHAGLFPQLGHLGALASGLPSLGEGEARLRLEGVLAFLKEGLLPHAEEEERSIYPAVSGVLKAVGGGTQTMTADHVFIRNLVNELAALAAGSQSEEVRDRERALLYGLQAVLELHFSKENEHYLPLLNLLSPDEKKRLHERLAGRDEAAEEDLRWPT